MGKNKEIKFSKNFKYDEDKLEYDFQLKKRRNWWWLLLCLLPLLLFIRCEKDINVSVYTANGDKPVKNATVSMSYKAHFLYNDGEFFSSKRVELTKKTDNEGSAVFEKLPCSVYSYIFYCMNKVKFVVNENCYDQAKVSKLFHFTRNADIALEERLCDFDVRVEDLETGIEIPGAKVEYVINNIDRLEDAQETNAAGRIFITDAWLCGFVEKMSASVYGYADTTVTDISTADIMDDGGVLTLKLRPMKEQFDFFVKNKFTKQPIPGAKATVTITDRGNKQIRGISVTNVDGMGRGFYENAFVLAKVGIEAKKQNYKDGVFDGDYTVEEFKKLPDSLRVVYLEPEPYVQEFQNVDSVTRKSISGVLNHITVSSQDGRDYIYTEMSNSRGYFPVKAMEGDKIKITSILPPYYKDKNTYIGNFIKSEIIYMIPETADLSFRTLDLAEDTLLADCNLKVYVDSEMFVQPTNSGNGEFTVNNVFVGSTISIIASKAGYRTNNYTICNKKIRALMNSMQHERDIPMELDIEPCNGGESGHHSNIAAGTISAPQTYSMGTNIGTFNITYNTYELCSDRIQIYNHKPGAESNSWILIFDSGQVVTNGEVTQSVTFSNGSAITVVVTTGPDDGSAWNYHVSCPE